MKILGIDYGRSKVGIAISEGKLSSPLKVIRYSDIGKLKDQILKLAHDMFIDEIVVGISEGDMAKESKEFAKSINAKTFDETLSTHEAQELSKMAGIGQKKRREMEDAYAASVMLQNYLDSN